MSWGKWGQGGDELDKKRRKKRRWKDLRITSRKVLFRNYTEHCIYLQFTTYSKNVVKKNAKVQVGSGIGAGGGIEYGPLNRHVSPFWILPRQSKHRISAENNGVEREITGETIKTEIKYHIFHYQDYLRMHNEGLGHNEIVKKGSPWLKPYILHLDRVYTEYNIVGPKVPPPTKKYVENDKKTDAQNAELKKKLDDDNAKELETWWEWFSRRTPPWLL